MHALVAQKEVEDADVVSADDEGCIVRWELLVMEHIVHTQSWTNPNVACIHFNGRGKGRGRMVCENLQEKMELVIEFIGEMW